MGSRFMTMIAAVAAVLTTALVVPSGAPALLRASASENPFSLSARALDGPTQTDLYLSVTGDSAEPPTQLGLVQVKVFDAAGQHLRTETFHDVASPDGHALLTLSDVDAKHVLEIKAHAKEQDQNNIETRADVLQRPYGAVSSDVPQATDVGIDILEKGGNAVDAAVAMQFALSVTQPQNAGLGGGATVVVHMAGKGDFAIDARELSPADTDPHQYHVAGVTAAKTNGNSSGFIVGVPGSLKLAETMLERWGTTSLSDSLQPAIGLAENGFTVGPALETATAPGRRCQNVGQPETKALFCTGAGLAQGSTFNQPDLADTFRLIAEQGTDVFYKGEIAAAIVEATRRNRVPDGSGVGKMTLADIAAYNVDDAAPIGIEYRDHDLLSIGGASRGGYLAFQMLRMLDLRRDEFPLGDVGRGFGWLSPDTAHLMAEVSGLAFADHFYWTGGGPVPGAELLSDCYLETRAQLIKLDARIVRLPRPHGNPLACSATALADESPADDYSSDGMTTHYSVLDKWGNAVSFTTTLTDAFGSGILVPEYGFVLNDALSNFNGFPAAKPGAYPGPGDPGMNDAAPSKRPGGYTVPLIALKDGEPILITGSPGGAAIPSVVVNVVMNVFDHGMALQEAVDRARVWFNLTSLLWSEGVPAETLAHLRTLRHGVAAAPATVGGAHSIFVDPLTFALSVAKDRLIPGGTARAVVLN